ncbi:MAG: hypothetical protein M5U31_15720 [Acidimicrobiia bacterium]|nr:hypothetical protein [Acidimicrobiia bacterium]
MADDPNPSLDLTTIRGITRSLDDWTTTFNLAVVVLPGRPEASTFLPVIERIYATLEDSDVRTTICIAADAAIAHRILGDAVDRWMVFCDPDAGLAAALGLGRMPAFVHLRQDTTVVDAAEGFDPVEWQRVADGIARASHWTSPVVAGPGCPRATPGWALTA